MTDIQQPPVAVALDTLGATAKHWTIDAASSTFELHGRYLFGPAITARFAVFFGSVEVDDDRSAISATLLLDAATLNSGIALRDEHIRERRNALDVHRYPFIRFDLERATPATGDAFDIDGSVTIRDITQPVALHVDARVTAEGADLSVTGTVDHRPFKVFMPALSRNLTVHAQLRAIPHQENP